MKAAVLKMPAGKYQRACAGFVSNGSNRLCLRCTFAPVMHKTVWCSSCGSEFYGVNEGFSSCDAHAGRRAL